MSVRVYLNKVTNKINYFLMQINLDIINYILIVNIVLKMGNGDQCMKRLYDKINKRGEYVVVAGIARPMRVEAKSSTNLPTQTLLVRIRAKYKTGPVHVYCLTRARKTRVSLINIVNHFLNRAIGDTYYTLQLYVPLLFTRCRIKHNSGEPIPVYEVSNIKHISKCEFLFLL